MKINTDWFIEKVLRFRFLVLLIVLMFTAIFGYFLITQLKIDNDPTHAIPADLKAMVDFKTLNKYFPARRSILILVKFDGDDLKKKITFITNCSASFSKIKGVVDVYDAANLNMPVKSRMGGFLSSFGVDSEPILKNGMTVEQFRERFHQNRQFAGVFMSDDESVMCILASLDNAVDKSKVGATIYEQSLKFSEQSGIPIYLTGAPMYSFFTSLYMKKDMMNLVPIALLIVFVLLFFVYRRFMFVFASIIIILIALIWTFGLMAMMGIALSVVSSMVPVILLPIGVADSIHIIKTYIQHREEGRIGLKISLKKTYQELTKPVILTTITTFIGFASFSFSNIEWVKYFGLFTGLGTVLALLLTLLLLPVFISFVRSKNWIPFKKRFDLDFIWDPYFRFLFHGKKWSFLIAIIIISGIWGVYRINVDSNPISLFKEQSDVRKTDRLITDYFGGTRFFSFTVTPAEGSFHSAVKWNGVKKIARYIEEQTNVVGKVDSFLPFIHKIGRIKGVLDSSAETNDFSSRDDRLIRDIVFLPSINQLRGMWVDNSWKRARIRVTCRNVPYFKYDTIVKDVRTFMNKELPGWKMEAAGAVLINDSISDLIIDTQISSLLLSFFAVFLLLSILFKSIKRGFFAIIPIIFSTIFVFAIMGIFNITLNMVTVIMVNTTVGIGIDYSIHFMSGYLFQRANGITDKIQALKDTIKNKGMVIMFNTLIVGMGFLILAVSNFPPIRSFGFLVFSSMFTSSAFALIFLPVSINIFEDNDELYNTDDNDE